MVIDGAGGGAEARHGAPQAFWFRVIAVAAVERPEFGP
jgi:hypothetical protein